MRLFYRISDQSYEKPKLPGATKEACLMNFCKAFASVLFTDLEAKDPPLTIIADRCNRKTVKMLTATGFPVVVSDRGNAGSLQYTLQLAIERYTDEDLIYLVEDDYLHLGNAPTFLTEGIRRADYITLYDHPDKYTRYYDGGEISKVIKTTSSHWRYTASTCMTFATKVKTLKEDLPIWQEFTSETHPCDHEIFKKLSKEKRRRLAVCIPGVACHTDLTFSGAVHSVLIEPWAIELMINDIQDQIGKDVSELIGDKKGWDKLLMLDAIKTQSNLTG